MAVEKTYHISCPFCLSGKETIKKSPGQKVTCDKCGRLFSGYRSSMSDTCPLIGELALQYGTVTSDKLGTALKLLEKERKNGTEISLESIFIRNKMATSAQVKLLKMIGTYIEIREISESFGKTAISLGFATPHDIEKGLIKQENEFKKKKNCLLIGDILIEDGILSLEQCENIVVELDNNEKKNPPKDKETESDTPIPLSEFEEKFLSMRSFDKEFCKKVLQKRVASKDDIRTAYNKQTQLFKKRNILKHVGEILVHDNILTEEQCLLVFKEMKGFGDWPENLDYSSFFQNLEKKLVAPEKKVNLKKSAFEISVSHDNMSADLIIDRRNTSAIKVSDVKKELAVKGIVYGLIKDVLIAGFLKEGAKRSLQIAKGKPPEEGGMADILYHFDTRPVAVLDEKERKKSEGVRVPRGKILAEKKGGGPPSPGMDIYGKTIPVPPSFDIKLKCGAGARFSEDGSKVYAKNEGVPRLSIDGKIFVFSQVHIHDDANLKAGPLGDNNNISIAGTLTGAYPVKGGDLKADEIRDADVDIIGDVDVKVGINKTKITTQGAIYAKYIMDSTVYAFGDIVVENEIIDSEIVTSGRCIVKNSRIIGSAIYAKRGIVSAGIGSPVTEPCRLEVGREAHIDRTLKKIDDRIEILRDEIRSREKEIKKIELDVVKNSKKIKTTRNRMDSVIREGKKVVHQFETVKSKKNKKELTRLALLVKENDGMLKKLKQSLNKTIKANEKLGKERQKIKKHIESIRPGIDEKITAFNEDKEAILKWSHTKERCSELWVKGKISSGTMICGVCSELTLDNDYSYLLLKEKINKEGDTSKWVFSNLKKKVKT